MPVGRMVLKSISESKKLSKLKTDGARLLYTWLLTHLDVNGCFSGDPIVINGQVFTRLNKSIQTIQEYLNDLQQNGLIILYSANGDDFLFVPDFTAKQPQLRPDREGKPRIPIPTPEQLQTSSRPTPAQVKLSKVKLSKDNARAREEVSLFNAFWEEYPKKVSKQEAQKAFEKINPDQELLDKMLTSIRSSKKTQEWLDKGGQFIPHPATWLNKKRWEDDQEPIKQGTDATVHYQAREWKDVRKEIMEDDGQD